MRPFDVTILVLRLAIGVTMMTHGLNKARSLDATAGWFASMGFRPGALHARMAAATEVLGGAGLAVGLLTPLAAAAVIGVLVVAGVSAHAKNGFFIFRPNGGWEYVFVLAVVSWVVGSLGAGRYSLDHALDWSSHNWTGAVVAGLVGVVGGLAHLAVFWRPKSP